MDYTEKGELIHIFLKFTHLFVMTLTGWDIKFLIY